ncbi:MAG: YggS family pyridoxal phosphate-dependent enzyme [Oscillospiraceae bacterium]|nr:YggS family pyridoxal phosphate-dependent enzyme [Oscillospiraceae bacterium]
MTAVDLQENIRRVKENIAAAAREAGRDPGEVTLVAATKTQTDETIRAAIAAGVTVCGENRVQELVAHLDHDAYGTAGLHFIGHLQTNKVKYVVGRVDLIESVDSLRLLEAIEVRAAGLDRVQDILLQVNIGREETKSGVPPEEAEALAQKALELSHVRLRGLMAIPPAARSAGSGHFFREMKQLFVDIKQKIDDNKSDFNCLSMGMSGDYPDAVRAGATHVRVGSAIFGPRLPKGVAGDMTSFLGGY